MQHVEVERTFPAPIEQIWERYTDHASWSDWAGVSTSILEKEGAPHRNGVGALRRLGTGPVNAWEEVLEFEPPKRMVYTVVRGGLPIKNHRGEVQFDEVAGGTRVVWRCEFDSRIPGLGGVLRRLVTKVFRDALGGLAGHLPT